MELTTVADDEAVVHDGFDVRVYDELEPETVYSFDGFEFRTLPQPGEHLCTFATVNDVHFGETECGIIEGLELGPIYSSEPGEPPYPETMNKGAIAEMLRADPAAVVVKGDLTAVGSREEYDWFLAHYRGAFGERLYHVRGNHDAYHGQTFAADAPIEIVLPGVRLAVLDTVIPRETPGQVSTEQLQWLDELGERSDTPVLVFGHHHIWSPDSNVRPENYFGINPDDSERLVEVFVRRPALGGYFAGHTHRNRVRRVSATAEVPWVEVACTKDFPGSWAEYRVFEGGILQIHRRISDPPALAWTEKTRDMYGGIYFDYAFGELSERCFVVRPRG